MKNAIILLILFSAITLFTTSCRKEDPGPFQEGSMTFPETGFERIEAGDALDLSIMYDSSFSISAEGDIRNLNDLEVSTIGSTLHIKYRNWRERRHQTYITIKMPVLKGVDLSGASNSTIHGFQSMGNTDISLSGASNADVSMAAGDMHLKISGASKLTLNGSASYIDAELSGASSMNGFDMPASQVEVNASGASNAKVHAAQTLNVEASGASSVIYRGSPSVTASVSGASTVRPE